MFLKKKWNNIGIKSKTFIATISSVTLGLAILCIILYSVMPKVYKVYKKENLKDRVGTFVSILESDVFTNINQTVDDFCLDNDLMIIITSENDEILYSSFNNEKINNVNRYNEYKALKMNKVEESFRFYFKQYELECNLNVQMNIQAGKEIRTIIMVFLPFAAIANILIAITMTTFYSKVISTSIIFSNILKKALKESYYFIEEKNLKLEEDIKDDIFINGDEKLLYKAVSNIVKNAVEHTPEDREISVILNEDELMVKNYGVHIESEDLKSIFKAFYRVDKSRNNKTGGTGLGLYIVSSALNKHENLKFNMESGEDFVLFKVNFLKDYCAK
ncbi:MAG: hypothetical protein E7214_07430 [Clostridium sp.]|nr:hypothetical protein [Clostridium sp.]